MKHIFTLLISAFLILFCTSIFASPEPVISHNVPVVMNAQPSQCPSSYESDAAPEDVQTYSSFGDVNTLSGPGVRSCSNCAIDSNHNCVCQTCYDNYMSF
jgi:hypothetical protein